MDWISLPVSSSRIHTNMGEIQRYLGPQAYHTVGQYHLLCGIPDSGFEYQYQDVDCCESYSRNWWWWFDHLSQHLY